MLRNGVGLEYNNKLNVEELGAQLEHRSADELINNEALPVHSSAINIPTRVSDDEEHNPVAPPNSVTSRASSISSNFISLDDADIISPNSQIGRQDAAVNFRQLLERVSSLHNLFDEEEIVGHLELPRLFITDVITQENTPTHSISTTPVRRESDATTIDSTSTEDTYEDGRASTQARSGSLGLEVRRVSFMDDAGVDRYLQSTSDEGGVPVLGHDTPDLSSN